MRNWQNHPAVIAGLCIILVGAVAVMALRIKSAMNKTTVVKLVARQDASVGTVTHGESFISVDGSVHSGNRDPFYHALLFIEQRNKGSRDKASLPFLSPGMTQLQPYPLNFPGIGPPGASTPGTTNAPSGTPETIKEPALKLQGVVSGSPPMAIIKVDDKIYFTQMGDHFGEGYTLTSVRAGEIVVQYEGKNITLGLEEGLNRNANT